MSDYNLTAAEAKLADILWHVAPVTSPVLVDIAQEKLGWKKSTTYTVLKRLCDKGIFTNTNAEVATALTREELLARQSHQFVDKSFSGSLPGFIAAFVGGAKLSSKECSELVQLIEAYQEGQT